MTVVVWYGATAVPFGGPVGAAAPNAGAAEANASGQRVSPGAGCLVDRQRSKFTGAEEATACSGLLLLLLRRLSEAAKGRRGGFGRAEEATGGSSRGSGRLTKSRGSSACKSTRGQNLYMRRRYRASLAHRYRRRRSPCCQCLPCFQHRRARRLPPVGQRRVSPLPVHRMLVPQVQLSRIRLL
jgi:hypothetical protein